MSFLFKGGTDVEIELSNTEKRNTLELKKENGTEKLFLFVGDEPVSGNVHVKVSPGKPLEHQGIKIELLGQIELFYDRGNHYEFTSLVRDLAPAGNLTESKTFPFEFLNVEKPFESYNGVNAKLRYFLKVTISRGWVPKITKELDIWVHSYVKPPEINHSIKMEVGIEDCLHIEFEYNRSKYHLKDVIIGKVYFLLVRIKIKHMEIALIKRESTGSGQNLYNENETITKFEVMDGAPVKGESIPVRLFLGGFELTPTYRSVHNKFSVKYFINLVIIDEDDRRYFKQQEVVLWRKQPKKKRSHKISSFQEKSSKTNETDSNLNADPVPTTTPSPENESK